MRNTENEKRGHVIENIAIDHFDEDALDRHSEAIRDALIDAFDAGRRAAQWDAIEACRALHAHATNFYDDFGPDMLAIIDQARRAIGEPVSVPDDREISDPN